MKTFTTVDELEAFILKHGENIVDLMGGEIDRIEIKLRVKENCHHSAKVASNKKIDFILSISFALQKKFPEIRHCDLEIL